MERIRLTVSLRYETLEKLKERRINFSDLARVLIQSCSDKELIEFGKTRTTGFFIEHETREHLKQLKIHNLSGLLNYKIEKFLEAMDK